MKHEVRHKEKKHSKRKEGVKIGRGSTRYLNQPGKEKAIEHKEKYHSDKSPLLSKCGKNKICLILREVAQF
jgi:hypothetical protein